MTAYHELILAAETERSRSFGSFGDLKDDAAWCCLIVLVYPHFHPAAFALSWLKLADILRERSRLCIILYGDQDTS